MSGPLRIAYTLEQCWHEVPGGTARAALDTVAALMRWTTADVVGVAARHRHPPPPPWVPPVEVRQLGLPRLALYEAWHRLRVPPVEVVTGPVDVIHATGVAVPPRSAPLVVTVNDLAFEHDPSQFTRRGVSFFRRAAELARRDADVVVCPSAATLADCRRHGFDPERLRLVPYGTDAVRATAEQVASVRARFGLTAPFVIWVGTLEPRKNLPGLLRAFDRLARRVSGVELVLVGPVGWNDAVRVVRDGVGDRVRWLGFVSPEELRSLYAGAAVCCYPSLREGFGLPVLEAMAQGTPVVTSAGTATEEIAGPDGGAGLLVDPVDDEAIATALERVLTDADEARRMAGAAVARAASFSWRRTAEDLARVYAAAAGVVPAVSVPS